MNVACSEGVGAGWFLFVVLKIKGPQCAQNGRRHSSTRTPGAHSASTLWPPLRELKPKFKGPNAYTWRIDAYRIAGGTKAFVANFHNANYVRLQHLFVGCPITHWLILQPVWFWLKFRSPLAFWRVTQQPGSELFIISRDIKFEPRPQITCICDRWEDIKNLRIWCSGMSPKVIFPYVNLVFRNTYYFENSIFQSSVLHESVLVIITLSNNTIKKLRLFNIYLYVSRRHKCISIVIKLNI